MSDRPTFGYPFQTGFLHSSTSLQGLRARVKWAGPTTFEEPDSAGTPACTGNLNGRVAVENPFFEGLKVLGDPFDEYNIPGFAPPS